MVKLSNKKVMSNHKMNSTLNNSYKKSSTFPGKGFQNTVRNINKKKLKDYNHLLMIYLYKINKLN